MSESDPIPRLDVARDRTPPPREDVRERLLAQAHLFDDPAIYRSGIMDAFAALEEQEGR
jgi:hypothetical protein